MCKKKKRKKETERIKGRRPFIKCYIVYGALCGLFLAAVVFLLFGTFWPSLYLRIHNWEVKWYFYEPLQRLCSAEGFRVLGTSIGVTGGALSFLISRVEFSENGVPVYQLLRWKYRHVFLFFYILFLPAVALQIYSSTLSFLRLPSVLFSVISFAFLMLIARISYVFVLDPKSRNNVMWEYLEVYVQTDPRADGRQMLIQAGRSLLSKRETEQLSTFVCRWGELLSKSGALDVADLDAWGTAVEEASGIWRELISFPPNEEQIQFVARVFAACEPPEPIAQDEKSNCVSLEVWWAILLGFLDCVYLCRDYFDGKRAPQPVLWDHLSEFICGYAQMSPGAKFDLILVFACYDSCRHILLREKIDIHHLRWLAVELWRGRLNRDSDACQKLCVWTLNQFEHITGMPAAKIALQLRGNINPIDLTTYEGILNFIHLQQQGE